jgi:hypothetical protein
VKDSEFIQERADRSEIMRTCSMVDTAGHKLMLMSRRQRMTATELKAQVGVLLTWLNRLDEQLGKPAETKAD